MANSVATTNALQLAEFTLEGGQVLNATTVKNNICPALIRNLMEDSIIFKYLSHLNRLLNLWFVLPGVFILTGKLLLPFVLILRMLILPVLSATYTKGAALKQDRPIHQNPHGPADCVPFSYVILNTIPLNRPQ